MFLQTYQHSRFDEKYEHLKKVIKIIVCGGESIEMALGVIVATPKGTQMSGPPPIVSGKRRQNWR